MRSWIGPAVLMALLLGAPLTATPPQAADACCTVVSVDSSKGTVTIRNVQTGKVSTVRNADRSALGRLKVGQKVQASGLPPARAARGTSYY